MHERICDTCPCHLFAANHKDYMCLLLICRQVGTNLVIPGGARTIEARGKLVMPGKQAKPRKSSYCKFSCVQINSINTENNPVFPSAIIFCLNFKEKNTFFMCI